MKKPFTGLADEVSRYMPTAPAHTPVEYLVVRTGQLLEAFDAMQERLGDGGITKEEAMAYNNAATTLRMMQSRLQLYAAAPELLEALHRCADCLEIRFMTDYPTPIEREILTAARAALSKATGGAR